MKRKATPKRPASRPKCDQTPRNSRAFFRGQILRLSSTRYFPALDEGVKELIDTLMEVTKNDGEAGRRIINHARLESPNCPTPADLAAIAKRLAWEATQPTERPEGCQECDKTGWKPTTRKVKDAITQQVSDVDGVEPCRCSLGRFLAAARARKADEPQPAAIIVGGVSYDARYSRERGDNSRAAERAAARPLVDLLRVAAGERPDDEEPSE